MRIDIIIDSMPECELMAEVGCDHAKLTSLALKRGKAKEAIVSDISAVCLRKAKKTLQLYKNVTFLVGDGVVSAGREPNCILICGMGGHTISGIISRYSGDANLVLSPQSHPELVRMTLAGKGYAIVKDFCFSDRGKFYDLIAAEKGESRLTGMQIKYGKFFTEKCADLRKRLERRLAAIRGGGTANDTEIREITEVLEWQK